MIHKFKLAGALTAAVVAIFAATATAAQAQAITSEKYPATITASAGGERIHAFGSTILCSTANFSATITAASTKLTVTPTYTVCTAFGLPATVNFTSCDYLLDLEWAIDRLNIACSTAGDAVDINVYASSPHGTPICHVKIPAQSNLIGYTPWNNLDGTVTLYGEIGGITVTQTRTSIFCPAGTHSTTARYTIRSEGIKLSGNNGAIAIH